MLSPEVHADIAARYEVFYASVELPAHTDEVVARLIRELAVPLLHRHGPEAVSELLAIATEHRDTLRNTLRGMVRDTFADRSTDPD